MKQKENTHFRNCNPNLTTSQPTGRKIVLPISYDNYQVTMATAKTARKCLDEYIKQYPNLFPASVQQGYQFHGMTQSTKMEAIQFRRIRTTEMVDEKEQIVVYEIRSCDILSYYRGITKEVEHPLLLLQFGVPIWVITHIFGKNDMYWYRLFQSFGHYSLVGTTVQKPELLPEDLGADEKHTDWNGEKCYLATTVGENCILGVQPTQKADQPSLQEAYGTFQQEARELNPNYQPKTVNTDGWGATKNAWLTLFPAVTLILCFLHGYLKIRDCCQKKYQSYFEQIREQVWSIYHCEQKEEFVQHCDKLEKWIKQQTTLAGTAVYQAVLKLCTRKEEYAQSYLHPTCLRTSNMVDRQMQAMDRWLFNRQYFSGHMDSANYCIRAWALLHNYRPYCPRAKIGNQYQSPAHQLNKMTYRENWLENLLVSTSCQGFRQKHRKS